MSHRVSTLAVFLCLILPFGNARAADGEPETPASNRPNILWINAEDMSPHLGCYGHPDANTPHIDRLASQGIVYKNAFATAPICSPARTCLATGLYGTSLGTQHLRCEVEIPEQVVPLAVRLRQAGYFCTNTGKSDYNFSPDGIWDAWSNDAAPWRSRKSGQPFFAFITVGETHEGRINFRERYEQATEDLPDELRHAPSDVTIPPFYPDTAEIRSIFAGMHDLATVFDRKVADMIGWLRQDGDLENTIIFVFGDHGNGLPRYKRWLNDSGLRVPLVVYVPPKFQVLSPHPAGSATDRMVSFVDFPATALSLAGIAGPPTSSKAKLFWASISISPRKYIFGARSRADDMFEVSRSVFDGRYLYVRHFLPHVPYIQNSVIFDDRKASFRELRKLHLAGKLNEHAEKLWSNTKPTEELYDLQTDPHELTNLANNQSVSTRKDELARVLRQWMRDHRDAGLLTESEYQIRAAANSQTPFEIVQDPNRFDIESTLDAAWRVGDPAFSAADLRQGLRHAESGVRYWSATAAMARNTLSPVTAEAEKEAVAIELAHALQDSSPSVRIAAAEGLLRLQQSRQESSTANRIDAAVSTLAAAMRDKRPWVSLEAASASARLGDRSAALIPVMKEVVNRNRSEPGSRRPYRDFNYASFTGWALEAALSSCGEHDFVDAIPK